MNCLFVRFLFILIFLVLCISHSDAGSIDWGRVHDLTMRGIHQLYRLEVDSAVQAFDSVSQMAPGDPRGPFFRSMVHFYLYGLNRDEKVLATFFNESELVIQVCESLLERNEQDATTKFYLGGIYGYRGMAYHTNGSLLKAARDGRKGYLLLEEAVAESPKLYDAHMGFGLFRYLLAKVPKSMRWILSVLGVDGDLEGGLNSLRLAAKKGVYTQTEAKLFLAQFLFSEGREDTALQYLNELRLEFPENTLFIVLYASWQHRMHNLAEAMVAARIALNLNNRKRIRYGEDLVYSTLGSVYFTLNNFEEAKHHYQLYMEKTRNDQRTPNITYLRAGLACELAGDRATALRFVRRMTEPTDRDRAWDGYNYRRGQELLAQPLSEAEIMVVKAANESTQKNYARAIELYQEGLHDAGGNVDLQARALYGIQQAQNDAGLYPDAVETANRLLVLKPVKETWIIPHAWFKLGQMFVKQGRVADARVMFQRVDEYDDYEFQERLEDQVRKELAKLNR